MKYRTTVNFARTALAVAISVAFPPAAFAQVTATADASTTLETIVITAEKRLTVLDKTPEAISAISGAKLKDIGASGFEDIAVLVPNVSYSQAYGVAKINIRGIGYNYGDPGVATYVDGTYISDLLSANTGMFDLQRVEVMRGPQGALYGRNATGGAVNYVTALPTNTFKGQASVLVGNYGRRETEGFVSGPLGDSSTTARLSFQIKSLDGYVRNTIAGNSYASVFPGYASSVAPDRLDDLDTKAVRLQTLTDLGENGKLRLILANHREDDVGANNAILPQSAQNSLYLFGISPGTDRFSTSSNGQSNLVDASSLQAIYERPLGSNTLTVSASYRKSKFVFFNDGDSTPALVGSSLLKADGSERSIDAHIASDESARLQWLLGVTYLDADGIIENQFQQKLSAKMFNPLAPAAFAIPNNLIIGGEQNTRSTAFYVDGRYAITPTLALRGGLRASRDEKDVSEFQTTAAGTRRATPSASWSSTPGNIGLEWNATKETMVYGKVSHGFKAGAINLGLLQATAVKPETVTSVEVGIKTSFLDNRGAFSAALFSSDYKDMQMFQQTALSASLINAPGAKIKGLELELLLRPISALTLGGNLGWMDPKFTQFSNTSSRNPAAGLQNLEGKQITNVSRTQANLNAELNQSIGGYKTSFRADYVWRDKFYFTEFNDPDVMQEAYGVFNLSASIRPQVGKWKLYAQVKNATDIKAYSTMGISGTPNAGHRAVVYIPPRTYGIGVQLDF